jgi:hypothetical protein
MIDARVGYPRACPRGEEGGRSAPRGCPIEAILLRGLSCDEEGRGGPVQEACGEQAHRGRVGVDVRSVASAEVAVKASAPGQHRVHVADDEYMLIWVSRRVLDASDDAIAYGPRGGVGARGEVREVKSKVVGPKQEVAACDVFVRMGEELWVLGEGDKPSARVRGGAGGAMEQVPVGRGDGRPVCGHGCLEQHEQVAAECGSGADEREGRVSVGASDVGANTTCDAGGQWWAEKQPARGEACNELRLALRGGAGRAGRRV